VLLPCCPQLISCCHLSPNDHFTLLTNILWFYCTWPLLLLLLLASCQTEQPSHHLGSKKNLPNPSTNSFHHINFSFAFLQHCSLFFLSPKDTGLFLFYFTFFFIYYYKFHFLTSHILFIAGTILHSDQFQVPFFIFTFVLPDFCTLFLYAIFLLIL
jgi:hypothetical protein